MSGGHRWWRPQLADGNACSARGAPPAGNRVCNRTRLRSEDGHIYVAPRTKRVSTVMLGTCRPRRIDTSLPQQHLDQVLHCLSDHHDDIAVAADPREDPIWESRWMDCQAIPAVEISDCLPTRPSRRDTQLVDDRCDPEGIFRPFRQGDLQRRSHAHVMQNVLSTRVQKFQSRHGVSIASTRPAGTATCPRVQRRRTADNVDGRRAQPVRSGSSQRSSLRLYLCSGYRNVSRRPGIDDPN